MIDALKLVASVLASLFKSLVRLEAEIVVLRHQLMILRRKAPARPRLSVPDRLICVWLCRLRPSVISAVTIVRPENGARWHRAGFRLYWRWTSRATGGRPRISLEVRRLIRKMSLANPLWGAPRIHGELLKLGVEVAQSTVAKYMARGGRLRARAGRPCMGISASSSKSRCRSPPPSQVLDIGSLFTGWRRSTSISQAAPPCEQGEARQKRPEGSLPLGTKNRAATSYSVRSTLNPDHEAAIRFKGEAPRRRAHSSCGIETMVFLVSPSPRIVISDLSRKRDRPPKLCAPVSC